MLVFYGLLMTATIIVVTTARYLQMPVAVMFLCLAVTLMSFCFSPTPGFEWFVPMIFVKLVLGHAVAGSSAHDIE